MINVDRKSGVFAQASPQFICQRGRVEKLEGDTAFVRLEAAEGCNTCASKHSCGALSTGGKVISVRNVVGVQEGQRVELAVRPSAVVTASFLLFVVPVLACLAGIMGGYVLAEAQGWEGGEWIGLAFGMVGFGLAFLVIRMLNSRFERSGKYEPVITKILL